MRQQASLSAMCKLAIHSSMLLRWHLLSIDATHPQTPIFFILSLTRILIYKWFEWSIERRKQLLFCGQSQITKDFFSKFKFNFSSMPLLLFKCCKRHYVIRRCMYVHTFVCMYVLMFLLACWHWAKHERYLLGTIPSWR